MDRHNENQPAMIQRRNTRGFQMNGGKENMEVGNNRRALRDIKNFMGAPFSRPSIKSKPAIPEKNRNIEGHRPITRRFAASLAKKQIPPQDSRNELTDKIQNKNIIPTSKCSENLPIVDFHEDMEVTDPSMPTLQSQGEVPMEPMHQYNPEEVEMEDVVVETIQDIDSCDSKNPFAVVDYVEDIYAFYRQAEISSCISPNYMSHQTDINEKMRAILIDWLIEVHYKFELMDETLFLTVNLIDRFLEQQSVIRKKLQLVGVTAMLLACKYEEVSVPVVEDLILISDKAYTRDEVLAMEKLMINTLQFNLSVPTPYVFMKRFLKAAQSDKTLELLSFFMIELCLVEYEMLKFSPSLLAAAAIYTAETTLKGSTHWSKTSEWHTHYTEDQLQECSRRIVDFHEKAGKGKLTGVHRKYSSSKFGFAAKAEPAHFLLDAR